MSSAFGHWNGYNERVTDDQVTLRGHVFINVKDMKR
jgi:hypothetical protein